MKAADLFDFTHTRAGDYLQNFQYPWQALAGLKDFILSLKSKLGGEYIEVSPEVWVHKSAKIAPSAHLGAPCVIDEGAEVRHCAFIRGSALIGKNCVVGNSVELKNVILFDGVQVPHFNYVGDSVLGFKAHLGAGAITSNVKSDRSPVFVKWGGESVHTNLKKLGAMVGDFVEVGCNAVLNPGTVIGRNTCVYPLLSVRGTIPANSILKSAGKIVKKL